MLLDQERGHTWQGQWGLKSEERLISPIEAWTEIAAQGARREQAEKRAEKAVPAPSTTVSKPKVVGDAAAAPKVNNLWVNFGRPVKPPDADLLLTAAGLGNIESGLHPHERFHLHTESLLDA